MTVRPTQQFVKGQTILLEGSQGDRTFKIISGEVLVCKRNSEAELVPIAKLGPGEIFGEMYLFDGSKSRSASVIAASTDVVVEIYFQEEMVDMLSKTPRGLINIMHGFSHRLHSTSNQCAEMYQDKRIAKLPDGTMKSSGTSVQRNG